MAEEMTPGSEPLQEVMEPNQISAFVGQAAWNVQERFNKVGRVCSAEQLGAGILSVMQQYGYEFAQVNYEHSKECDKTKRPCEECSGFHCDCAPCDKDE